MERYSAIVAELRRRIESGELPPGAKVPSTREIVRERGVAMATATKVLAELRREGLVRAVPGVGTVVEGPQPAPATPTTAVEPAAAPDEPTAAPPRRRGAAEAPLALGRIVAAAVAVADGEGLAAVSMRRIAAELGVATMSLYRHVVDKDDLLMRMMDAAFAESPLPQDDAPEGWRERLALAGRLLWAMFRRHPWLAAALSVTRPQPVPSAMPLTEWVLATLTARGLDPSTALTAHITLFNHVRGTALSVEMESEAEEVSGLDSEEWMETQEPALRAITASGAFPVLQRVMAEGYDYELDGVFEFGLQRLLDGLAVLLGETGGGTG